jgi:peptidyl-prolyl cis-trans isomerase SurA
MIPTLRSCVGRPGGWPVLAALVAQLALVPAWAQAPATSVSVSRPADYIVAVVGNELVTQTEVEQRVARAKDEAARSRLELPEEAELRRQMLELLIDERVQVVNARDGGIRVDDAELDRAVENIATMNKLSPAQLRERLKADGLDYARFRANLRDQIMSERLREREVQSRIKITDAEIDGFLQAQRAAKSAPVELNIAQILVTVPEGAGPEVQAQRRAKVDVALSRLKAGEPFALVARAMSEDGNRDNGGEIGAKPMDRLPDLFVDAVKNLPVGAVAPTVVRSGAGFHVLKLLSRSEPGANLVTETRARHILLRLSPRLTSEDAQRRLAEFRTQVLAGKRRFDDLAREFSDDGSAASGGDLGWAAPGMFVPEFEQAMNALSPGGISAPVVSRFGVHLIQVVERRQVPVDPRQQREAARAALRERKFEPAYAEWIDDLRSRTFIEMREPPL